MAVLQACIRSAFKPSANYRINNSLPIFNKRVALYQSSSGRRNLNYQLPVFRRELGYRKLLQTSHVKHTFIYRLASTNVVTEERTNFPQSISEATNGSVKNDASGSSEVSDIVGQVDELPPIPSLEPPVEVADYIAAGLKEPPLESLGLASLYKPSGIIQYILEFLHINLDMPWWAAITTVTLTTRILLLPLSAKLRKNAVTTKNHMPELQKLQRDFTEARHSGNYYDAALAAQNLQKFMEEKKIGFSTVFPALAQIPVFLTVFFGLKGMKEVESLKTGGLMWFKDLTEADPYYVLPFLSSITAYAALQIGSDTGKLSLPQQQFVMQIVKIAFPFIVFIVTFKFPTCLVFYWTLSNFFTLGLQCLFLFRPVARFFNIPEQIVHKSTDLMAHKKGFREGFTDTLTNLRVTKELADRERLNTVTFEKAGNAPIQRTFKTNPKASVRSISSSK